MPRVKSAANRIWTGPRLRRLHPELGPWTYDRESREWRGMGCTFRRVSGCVIGVGGGETYTREGWIYFDDERAPMQVYGFWGASWTE